MKTILGIISTIVVLFVSLLMAEKAHFSLDLKGENVADIIYLVIFIGIVIFAFTYNKWSKKTKQSFVSCLIVYCCFNIFMVFNRFGIICVKKAPRSWKVKSCWSNCRILQGAVEMYNMDNKDMMEKLNIPLLIERNYLKQLPQGTEKKCYYTSHGDLSTDGYIYCIYHLVPEDDKEASNFPDYDNYRKLSSELKDEIEQAKIDCYNNKSFLEKFNDSFENYKPAFGILLLPILVAFFPLLFHPLRN